QAGSDGQPAKKPDQDIPVGSDKPIDPNLAERIIKSPLGMIVLAIVGYKLIKKGAKWYLSKDDKADSGDEKTTDKDKKETKSQDKVTDKDKKQEAKVDDKPTDKDKKDQSKVENKPAAKDQKDQKDQPKVEDKTTAKDQ